MTSVDTIYLFIFIFSIIAVIRVSFKFIFSLLQPQPTKLEISSRENFLIGLFITYIITYLIQT